MTGDSRGKRDVLGRKRRAWSGAVSLLALALCGCALSFEDEDGRRQVIGLFSTASEAPADPATSIGDVRHFAFYGVWFDDTLRGTSVAIGEVELSIADLRNQWDEAPPAVAADSQANDCPEGFGLHWCSLAPREHGRAGEAFDIAVVGLSIGAGASERHFGVGYHRQVLVEVTNANALVKWPAHVGLEGLLRGTFNG
jgi:hypothetical protein